MNKKRAIRLILVLSVFLMSDSCLSKISSCIGTTGIAKYDGVWTASSLNVLVPAGNGTAVLTVKNLTLIMNSEDGYMEIAGDYTSKGSTTGGADLWFYYHDNTKEVGKYLMVLADSITIKTVDAGLKTDFDGYFGDKGTNKQMYFTFNEEGITKDDPTNQTSTKLSLVVSNPPETTTVTAKTTYDGSTSEDVIDKEISKYNLKFVDFNKTN